MCSHSNVFHQEMLHSLSSLKALMMIAVVLSHSCSIWASSDWFIVPATDCRALGILADWLGLFDVPMFVFLSGYLYSYLKLETNRYNGFHSVINKKFRRLLVPYAFTCLFWAIPFWTLFFGTSEIVTKYCFGESPSQLWFLLMLFWLFVLFELLFQAISYRIWQGCYVVWLIIFALYLISFMIRKLPFGNCFQIANSLKYAPFFFAGFEFRRSNLPSLSMGQCVFLLIMSLSATILYFFVPFLAIPSQFSAVFLWFFVRTAGILMVLSAFAINNHFDCLPDLSTSIIWNNLVRNSMGIYLFHQQLVWCVVALLNHEGVHPIYIALLAFLVSVFGSDLITSIICKTPFGRRLLGC